MLFKYKGLNKEGSKVKGNLEAYDLNEVKVKLKNQGIIYSSLQEIKPIFKKNFFTKELPAKKLSSICRNLSIYLKSGVSSIVYAVKLEKQQHQDDKKMVVFFDSIENSLEEGNSFYNTLENQSIYTLPSFFKQSVKVAEESGTLGVVLKEMSIFLKNQEKIKGKITSAMAYPLFIIMVSFFMVGFMLSVVVPKITTMFDQLDQELPKITTFVVSLGDIVNENWVGILIVFFTVLFIFSYMYKHITKFTYQVDTFLLKLPLFGQIIQTSELAKFSYIVSVLINSGVTFVQAVKLSSNTIKNRLIATTFQKASDELVKGKKLSNALSKQNYNIDKSFIQAIALGEETSQMKDILQNLSELYNQENDDKINLMLSLLEPVLILFVGIIIGIIVTAMLLPIFSMNLNMQ
ncbi:type II secretion system F family protein [Sulfurospirillum arcachonense]|uniref:type II secretion system F family protein n=1 Tax=Sulfurospirillum arcachonense TaxID=57666 RepID=UPI00046962A7|nr:type II secretion system F family protein [Sulfurospirillum arcachonense]